MSKSTPLSQKGQVYTKLDPTLKADFKAKLLQYGLTQDGVFKALIEKFVYSDIAEYFQAIAHSHDKRLKSTTTSNANGLRVIQEPKLSTDIHGNTYFPQNGFKGFP